MANTNTITLQFRIKDDGSLELMSKKLGDFGDESEGAGKKAKGAFDQLKSSWMALVAQAYAFKEVIDIYNEHDRAVRAMNTTFGGMAADYMAQAQKISDASRNMFHVDEIMSSMSRFASGMKRYGIEGEEYVNMISRATDVAAGRNMELEETMSRLESAMRGEAESAEFLGLTLNDNYMKSMAFGGALKDVWEKMTDTEKAQYRYIEMMNQTGEYTGKAGEASQSFEGQVKILWNTLKDALIPVLSNVLIPVIGKVAEGWAYISRLIGMFVTETLSGLLYGLNEVFKQMAKLPIIGDQFNDWATSIKEASNKLHESTVEGWKDIKVLAGTYDGQLKPAVKTTIDLEQKLAETVKEVAGRNTKEREKEAEKIKELAEDRIELMKKMERDITRAQIDATEERIQELRWKYEDDVENIRKSIEDAGGKQDAIAQFEEWRIAREKLLNEEIAEIYKTDADNFAKEEERKQQETERRLKEQQKVVEEAQEKEKEAAKALSDEIVGIGSDLENWHENLWDRIVGYGLKKMAEYAAGVVMQIGKMINADQSFSLSGLFGMAGGGVPGVTGASGSSGIPGIPGLSSLGSFYLPEMMGGWEVGLGELGIAGAAGYYLPQLFGGTGGLPSALGSTAGYIGGVSALGTGVGTSITSAATSALATVGLEMIGAYVVPVIGAAIGTVLGEVIGGLLDSDHTQRRMDRGGEWLDSYYAIAGLENLSQLPDLMTQYDQPYKIDPATGQFVRRPENEGSSAALNYTEYEGSVPKNEWMQTIAMMPDLSIAVANTLANGRATAETAAALADFNSVVALTSDLMGEWGIEGQAAGQMLIDLHGNLTAMVIDDTFRQVVGGITSIEGAMTTLTELGMTPLEQKQTTFNWLFQELLTNAEIGTGYFYELYDAMRYYGAQVEENIFWTEEQQRVMALVASGAELTNEQLYVLVGYYKDLTLAIQGDTNAADKLWMWQDALADQFAVDLPTAIDLYIQALGSAETKTGIATAAIQAGISAGFTDGADGFSQAVRQSLYDTIVGSIIDALLATELYQAALTPFTDTLGAAMKQAFVTGVFDPTTFQAIMQPAIDATLGNITALETTLGPVWAMMDGFKTDLGLAGDEANEPGGVLDAEGWESVVTEAESLSEHGEEILEYLGAIRTELNNIEAINFSDKELRINVVPYLDGEAVSVDDLTDSVVNKIRERSAAGEVMFAA